MNALVGAVTFGQGAMALNFAEMSGKEAVTVLAKMWAVDAVADMSAYTVGYACDELGLPVGITFIASLMIGCTVSVKAGKYVFEDAGGSIVKELDADGMQAFIKEVDIDESLLGAMSEEELERYMKFLKDGSTAGLTQEELRAIQKVDERLLLEQIDYDEVLAVRKGVSGGGSGHRYSVDSTMFPDDEAAGVLRNGEYVKNPTAHDINDYISEGSNYLGSKNMNGQYMYVVDMEGNIIIGTRGGQRMPHPTLVGGSNPQVQAAGIVEIRGGKIYSINNASGHFKPSVESLRIAENAFSNLPQNIFSQNFKGYLPYGG